jgi:hypothetical protein
MTPASRIFKPVIRLPPEAEQAIRLIAGSGNGVWVGVTFDSFHGDDLFNYTPVYAICDNEYDCGDYAAIWIPEKDFGKFRLFNGTKQICLQLARTRVI